MNSALERAQLVSSRLTWVSHAVAVWQQEWGSLEDFITCIAGTWFGKTEPASVRTDGGCLENSPICGLYGFST